MSYRHTQTGPILPVFSVVGVIVIVVSAFLAIAAAIAAAIAIIVLWILVLSFNRLTVEVTRGEVSAAFGLGWPARRIALADITEFRAARSRWYYGWGLRFIPRGTMYNVWGLDVVELQLSNGRRFWIGTDEQGDLLAALQLESGRPPATPAG